MLRDDRPGSPPAGFSVGCETDVGDDCPSFPDSQSADVGTMDFEEEEEEFSEEIERMFGGAAKEAASPADGEEAKESESPDPATGSVVDLTDE